MSSSDGPVGGESWTIYVCPSCGHVENDELWDAEDEKEKGLPACPMRESTGCFDVDMELVEAVPLSALDDPDVLGVIRAACFDPGRYVERESTESDFGGKDYELLHVWQARAALAALRDHLTGGEGT